MLVYYVSIPVILHILIPAIIVPQMQMRMPITTMPPATPPTMIQGDTSVGGSAVEGERKQCYSANLHVLFQMNHTKTTKYSPIIHEQL